MNVSMKKIRFYILGSAELRNIDGKLDHSFLAGAKRLALFTYLVLNNSQGFIRRDHLLPLFWPEKAQNSARNSLSNMLYHIRQSLGNTILISRGTEELKLNLDLIWCDALTFQQALEEDTPDKAVELYRGELLEGFHMPNASPKLEEWLDQERKRFRVGFWDGLEELAIRAENESRFKEASELWKKRTEEDPFDTRIVKKFIRAMAWYGNHVEALQIAHNHGRLLEQELGINPDKVVSELTNGLDKINPSNELRIKTQLKSEVNSVAILPFEELGEGKDISNLANGLHHDLLTRLSGVDQLKVISRTSVLRYKGTNKSVHEIADELGVNTVVEGAIQHSNGQMRLHVQVIDAKKDDHEIAKTYDRKITPNKLFDVQSELAEKIAVNLRAYLSPKEKQRITEWLPTGNIEAYRCYTIGRRELDKRTKKSMQNSLKYFNQAVELDPEYTLAWIGLADALGLLHNYGYDSSDRAIYKASDAIKRALEIDPNLPEAHASKALLHSTLHEGPDSIKELLIAVDLQPNYAEAHNWLSWNYQLLGEAEKALESARRAVELDPLSPEANSNLTITNLFNGFIEEGLTEAERSIDLHPGWTTPRFYKGLILHQMGQYREAKSVLKDLIATWAGEGPLATTALCHAADGNHGKARELLDHFKSNKSHFAAGLVHAAFKEYDKAIEQFLVIEQWHEWPTQAIYFLYPDVLDAIRNHQQYSDIIKNVRRSWGQVTQSEV